MIGPYRAAGGGLGDFVGLAAGLAATGGLRLACREADKYPAKRPAFWIPPLWTGPLDPALLQRILLEELDPASLHGADLLALFAQRLDRGDHPNGLVGAARRPLLVPGWTPGADGPVRWFLPRVPGVVSSITTDVALAPLALVCPDYAGTALPAVAEALAPEPVAMVQEPSAPASTPSPLVHAGSDVRAVPSRTRMRRPAAPAFALAVAAAVLAVVVLPRTATRVPERQARGGDIPWTSPATPISPIVDYVAAAPSSLRTFATPRNPLAPYMTARTEPSPAPPAPKPVVAAAAPAKMAPAQPAAQTTPPATTAALPARATLARAEARPIIDAALATSVVPRTSTDAPAAPSRRRVAKAKRPSDATGRGVAGRRPDVATLLLPDVLKPQ